MKRLGRRLFNLAAMASLISVLIAIGLWIRSYLKHDQLSLERLTCTKAAIFDITYGVSQSRGTIRIYYQCLTMRTKSVDPLPDDQFEWTYRAWPAVTKRTLGVTWEYGGTGLSLSNVRDGNPAVSGKYLFVPHWTLVFLTSALPITWLLRKPVAIASEGHCQICGYDLRATPDRCPECGATPVAGKSIASKVV